jgi:hypothetical protein
MSLVLDENLLTEMLSEFPATREGVYLPEYVDKAKFDRFFRVLCAKDTGEIEDISVDEIFGMFQELGSFMSCIDFERHMTGETLRRFEEKRSVMSRRRVL